MSKLLPYDSSSSPQHGTILRRKEEEEEEEEECWKEDVGVYLDVEENSILEGIGKDETRGDDYKDWVLLDGNSVSHGADVLVRNVTEDVLMFNDTEDEDSKEDVDEYLDVEQNQILEGNDSVKIEGLRDDNNGRSLLLDRNAVSDRVHVLLCNVTHEDVLAFNVTEDEEEMPNLEGINAVKFEDNYNDQNVSLDRNAVSEGVDVLAFNEDGMLNLEETKVKLGGSKDDYKDDVLLDGNAVNDAVDVLVFNVTEDEEERLSLKGMGTVPLDGSRDDYNGNVLLDENAVVRDGRNVLEFSVVECGEEFGVASIKATSAVLEATDGQERVSDLAEEEELVKKTRALLEKVRDDVNADSGKAMDDYGSVGIEGSGRDYVDDTLLYNDVDLVRDDVDILVSNVTEGNEETMIEESGGKERVNDSVEEEELVKETRGLLEKIRDEGKADNAMVMDESCAEDNEGGGRKSDGSFSTSVLEIEKAVEAKITDADVGLEKPTGTTEAGGPKDSEETEEMKHVRDAKSVSEDVNLTESIGRVSESKNADNTVESERPLGEIKIITNILEAEKPMEKTRVDLKVVSSIVEEKCEPMTNKEPILQAGGAENNINQVVLQLIRDKESIISTNADVREIADESGLSLFDQKNIDGQQGSNALYDNTSVSEGHIRDEGVDFAELLVSPKASESTDARMPSQKDIIHSNGVLINEAKIWEQIKAMRNIVGYKSTPHSSCIEELKALYIFTGVEPPSSFNDSSDLAQVNHKLRFLMSIIGVK